MKTAINGKIRLKLFWGCTYSNSRMQPIETLFKIGRLILVKVVYPYSNPCNYNYHKEEAIAFIQKHFNIVWEPLEGADDDWQVVYSNLDGGYVGTPEDAYRLLQQGLTFVQKAKSEDTVCSIGYNAEECKWYGWSHRAMYGFGIGDFVAEGDCCASSGWTEEYLKKHPDEDKRLPVGFVANSMIDAMKMAIAFAESVS